MNTLPVIMVALFSPSPVQIQTSSALAPYGIVEVADIQTEDKAVANGYPVGLEERLRTQILADLRGAIGSASVLAKGQTTPETQPPEPPRPRVVLTVVIEDFYYIGDFGTANMARLLAVTFTGGGCMLFRPCRPENVTVMKLKAVFRDPETNRDVVILRYKETVSCAEHCFSGRSYFAPIVTVRAASGLAGLIGAHWRSSSAPTTSSRKERY
jgi:hypothetical protein